MGCLLVKSLRAELHNTRMEHGHGVLSSGGRPDFLSMTQVRIGYS